MYMTNLESLRRELKAEEMRRANLTEEERQAEDQAQSKRWRDYLENGDHCGNCVHQNLSPKCNIWDSRDEPDYICNQCSHYSKFKRKK
jgi:hypothetical protein